MLDPFTIRKMTRLDILSVRELHATLLPVSYSRSFFQNLLVQQTRVCLVAQLKAGGDPVAFISAAMHPEQQRIEILTLGVLAAYQRHRLATRLLLAVIDTLAGDTAASTAVFAQVPASAEPAKSFYKHMGLHPTDVTRDLYRNLPPGSRDGYLVSGRVTAAGRDDVDRIVDSSMWEMLEMGRRLEYT
ncbi:acyl-CoA N-acyltransferase [Mycena maculata]|uniref:Acyl-CoA N-acyltransferase n=1 Tax=Mycena maculata TaxID=230809 RepID=A0AAD7ND31_9AGAR|nr:acyl-CoA N-acyltransferase [Mycena maculata]